MHAPGNGLPGRKNDKFNHSGRLRLTPPGEAGQGYEPKYSGTGCMPTHSDQSHDYWMQHDIVR